MFSGIVETTGIISQLIIEDGCKHFTITPHTPYENLMIGESIAVNGVCLTVTSFANNSFNVTTVPETLRLTNLDALHEQDEVNLERAILANARIGGHYVQGHVDSCVDILDIKHDASQAIIVKMSLPTSHAKYLVKKGYVTLDGMSITVIDATPTWFTVTLIPHTQHVTIAKKYRVGTKINLEVDIMSKYVEKFLGAYAHANIH